MTGVVQLFPALMFVLGLVFGSFANVVIWRLPRGESLSVPPSHCPSCEHPIRWRDNVPVLSWLLLRGKCRDCGAAISFRYPAVELSTAFLWAASAWRFGLSWASVAAAAMCYLLLILSAIDFDTMRLPNKLVALLGVAGACAAIGSKLANAYAVPLTQAGGLFADPVVAWVTGSVLAGGVSWGIASAYKGVRGRSGFGMGDVKLLVALGPYLGVYTPAVLFLGSVLGSVWGVFAARRKNVGLSSKIPFGPFLALSAVIIAFGGEQMWNAYASLVGLA